jgi:phage-related protein
MIESLDFVYDGIESKDMNVYQISMDSGMLEEFFLPNRKINEQKVRGNDKPYFQGVELDPLSFPLSFYFDGGYDEEKIRATMRWLNQSYYKPFYFKDYPNRIFYAMYEGDSKLLHNGLQEGYVTMNMRCDSPYSYSPTYLTEEYDYSTNTVNGTDFTFINHGDINCQPEIWITMLEAGEVRIVNNSDGGRELKFTELANTEQIYVDNEREYIESSLANTYRYSNHNDIFLDFPRGHNYLKIYGKCKIQWRQTFKTLG